MPSIDLGARVTFLAGVGKPRAKLLHDYMRVTTIGDLLTYFPFKHIDRSRLYTVAELTADMPFVQLRGEILSFSEEGEGRKRRLVAHFTDGRGLVDLVWFNGLAYIRRLYKEHTPYIVFGRPSLYKDRFSIMHPDVDPADSLSLGTLGLQPYYSVPEKARKRGLTSRLISLLVSDLLRQLTEPLPETLPPYLVSRMSLTPRDEALRTMHFPPSSEALTRASFRLKFEELFYIQLSILRYARDRRGRFRGVPCRRIGGRFNSFYFERLPFAMTGAQKRVVREMWDDMRSGRQMNRLLQGDVGSGKTLVALMLMLIAIDNGLQACIMAPTEILASQHLATFRSMLGELPVRVELLTSSVKGKRRRDTLEGLARGDVNILVGTHAVIEDPVEFQRLGLAVIDEQHRFGVAQRARLWRKTDTPPHVLVMTATPIPRTLAMTLYGDLDVSVIDELPPGRKPVVTVHQRNGQRADLYEGMRRQLALGRQIYVVFPLIKESEKMDLRNLEDGFERLRQVFPSVAVGKVHGRMKPADKDAEMRRFAGGETRILVSTTVIEVGVNVPNASVMVIENAERFGLAQLHQLRGRVGRGADQSYCVLVTNDRLSPEQRKRIAIMTETTDGFIIAEEDMKLRGPGDMEGTQQSGMPFELRVANLARDGKIVQLARDTATQVLDDDKTRDDPRNAVLWQRLRELRQQTPDWSAIS